MPAIGGLRLQIRREQELIQRIGGHDYGVLRSLHPGCGRLASMHII